MTANPRLLVLLHTLQFTLFPIPIITLYWKDQIDVPIIQWLHRIAYNQHYWKNWPTAESPAMGTNGAFWAHTGMLVIASLQPSGAQ